MYKLEYCPFCGKQCAYTKFMDFRPYGLNTSHWVVRCGHCNAQSGECDTEQEAIKMWNIRFVRRAVCYPLTKEERDSRFGVME